jgi:phosphoribosylanthranilate isomerase
VKVCGITRPDDAAAAADAGASAIGVILWPGSPRYVTPERAADIASVAAAAGLTTVGVFVDQAPQFVEQIVRTARLDAIQLHGRESVGAYEIRVPIVKALGVGSGWHVGALSGLGPEVLVMLDVVKGEGKGATTIDWPVAAAAAAVRPIVLAGGLTPENVETAARVVRPYAVDVASGVESRPGAKDARRMRAFVAAVRAVAGDVPRGLFS